MAKPRYSYTFTLEREDAEEIERIAHNDYSTPTGIIKKAFLERLILERTGWKLGDERIGIALRAIAGLKGQKLERAIEFIEKL